MPNCRKCKNNFPNRIKIDGKYKILSSRKYCLVCSPYKKHNTRVIEKTKTSFELDELPKTKICNICNAELDLVNFGVYKLRTKYKIFSYCKTCDSQRVKKAALKLKLKAVTYKGGECSFCGYKKSLRALEFHHLVSEEKEINISRFRQKDWEALKKELDKCILLCSNCHREEHEKLDNGFLEKFPQC